VRMMIEGDRKVMLAASRFCWSCTKSWVGLAFRVQAKESPFMTYGAALDIHVFSPASVRVITAEFFEPFDLSARRQDKGVMSHDD